MHENKHFLSEQEKCTLRSLTSIFKYNRIIGYHLIDQIDHYLVSCYYNDRITYVYILSSDSQATNMHG